MLNAQAASVAIQSILEACDEKTKQVVLKGIKVHQNPLKQQKRKLVTVQEAKEDLITNYFKQ